MYDGSDIGMLQCQNIFRRTQFVGCRAKNRQPRRKKASVYDKLVCWHAPVSKILRWTQFVGFRAKNRQTTRKKAFWLFMAILGVLKLPHFNS